MIKYRAFFYIEGRDDSERGIYFKADNTTDAKEVIRKSVSDIYNCKANDVEFYNLVSEFEDPEAINIQKVGYDFDGSPIIDENPLILKDETNDHPEP